MPDLENVFAYRSIAVSNVAVGLSDGADPSDGTADAIPEGARYVTLIVGSYAVNFRPDGTAPTSSFGAPLSAGSVLNSVAVSDDLLFIRSTADDSTIHCLYGR